MTDPIIIERTELASIVRRAVIQANQELLQQFWKPVSPWITQNQAVKMLGKGGRGKLERAMARGMVRFHKKNPDTKLGRVMVNINDLFTEIQNP